MNYETNKKSIEYHGKRNQSIVAMEECGELIRAISKMLRYPDDGDKYRSNLVEEMADVYIVLEQLRIIYDVDITDVLRMIEIKQMRENKRMEETYYGGKR